MRSETASWEKRNQRCRNHQDRALKSVRRKKPGRRSNNRNKLVAYNPNNSKQTLVQVLKRRTPILPESVSALSRRSQGGTQLPFKTRRISRESALDSRHSSQLFQIVRNQSLRGFSGRHPDRRCASRQKTGCAAAAHTQQRRGTERPTRSASPARRAGRSAP